MVHVVLKSEFLLGEDHSSLPVLLASVAVVPGERKSKAQVLSGDRLTRNAQVMIDDRCTWKEEKRLNAQLVFH